MLPPEIDAALAECADPSAARSAFVRLIETAERTGILLPPAESLARVVPLLDCPAPAARLIASPRTIEWLTKSPFLEEEKPAIVFEQELSVRAKAAETATDLDRILRLYRHREMARIALRDLTRRAPLRVVVHEISRLADALTAAALRYWDAALAPRYGGPLGEAFCVIAMGKHGAQELNYSSDIDVLFVFDGDDKRHEQAVAIARAIIRSLSAITSHGFCFRVDANLRPYGRDGALAQTLDEMEGYYERAGQTWERAALIKARPCAGALDVGQTLIERLRPFVFRRTLDMAAVEAIAAMKRRIDREQSQSSHDNVKLGSGGIREIEFFVQALQLLHGGRLPALRVRATLDALEMLLYAGFISAQDVAALSEAYVFLRDTEHRLQLPNDRQTQVLPEPEEVGERRVLARRMGFADTGPFDEALTRHRREVHQRFTGLLSVAADKVPTRVESEVALDPLATEDARGVALKSLGFQDCEAAEAMIRGLQRQPDSAFGARARERHPGLGERLLEELARTPDPDLALARFSALFRAQAGATTELLGSNPATARLLLLLLGSSDALARDLQLRPELLDSLVRSDAALVRPTHETLAATIAERLAGIGDPEMRINVLRTLRREETLRVGLLDLSGQFDSAAVGERLTKLAELLLGAVLETARMEIAGRHGEPTNARLVVLGLGSLGGQELDYESDLDLVFVYEAIGPTSGGTRGTIEANEWAARVAQRTLSHLTLAGTEGLLYRVDARLRPSGSQGPLVTSLDAFAQYHVQSVPRGAALWERQALLRARPIAGNSSLGEAVVSKVLDPVAHQAAPSDASPQIADMRRRLDMVGSDGTLYPKKGPGGLLDIEFLTQLLQIKTGLREPSTRRAIDRLVRRAALGFEDGTELRRHYEVLRRVESRLRLLYGRTDVFVPSSGPGLTRLARQLGDAGADGGLRLRRDLLRTMNRVRELFNRIVR